MVPNVFDLKGQQREETKEQQICKKQQITFASRDSASRVIHRIASLPASRDMGHSDP